MNSTEFLRTHFVRTRLLHSYICRPYGDPKCALIRTLCDGVCFALAQSSHRQSSFYATPHVYSTVGATALLRRCFPILLFASRRSTSRFVIFPSSNYTGYSIVPSSNYVGFTYIFKINVFSGWKTYTSAIRLSFSQWSLNFLALSAPCLVEFELAF